MKYMNFSFIQGRYSISRIFLPFLFLLSSPQLFAQWDFKYDSADWDECGTDDLGLNFKFLLSSYQGSCGLSGGNCTVEVDFKIKVVDVQTGGIQFIPGYASHTFLQTAPLGASVPHTMTIPRATFSSGATYELYPEIISCFSTGERSGAGSPLHILGCDVPNVWIPSLGKLRPDCSQATNRNYRGS
ncbi:MAG: hypothetical protein AAFQ87_13245 [Bacteroidota bacterium]